ncbi:MAG: hypothetical protein DWQ31_20840 [Planctomycetota bacterium]|nr:MAG: hypothetical protein DWQ31_20840 [Planctomycetota bacterium]REJ96734.1 MAG: hypothetical protein DWQ35_03970 [Planctomycetota bacterium]REK22335.1 MAG: hypothetical protein DWQ42_17505 [Planctomycetota bacterium]REK39980.1 MAG: hypothetical protein DWQ46_17280 [Planctomycetota bacterium]
MKRLFFCLVLMAGAFALADTADAGGCRYGGYGGYGGFYRGGPRHFYGGYGRPVPYRAFYGRRAFYGGPRYHRHYRHAPRFYYGGPRVSFGFSF